MKSSSHSPTVPANEKVDFLSSIPFFAVHAAALMVFFVDFRWYYPLVAIGRQYLRMFGITAGFHRYFAHRSFKTSRWFQCVLAVLGTTSAQKGALWWASHHRHHHKYSDQAPDVHSPRQRSLWWAHIGWILCKKYQQTNFDRIRDFAKYPELRWVNRWYLVPPIGLGMALFLIGGLPLLTWGFLAGTTQGHQVLAGDL